MTYERPPGAKQGDFMAAREFELIVAESLPQWKVTRFDSNSELDIWVPGYYLEVKAKRQPLTERWHLLPGVDERNLFVQDELSVRRALKHYPCSYFLVNDMPAGRLFLANAIEFACIERKRVNRNGKGKWIVDLMDLRRIGRLQDINEFCQADMVAMPWKSSGCIGAQQPKEIA